MYGGLGNGLKAQRFWAGDGDDLIVMGDKWLDSFAYGYSGDDTIYLGEHSINVKYHGGEGNDKIYGKAFDETDFIPPPI